MQQYLNCIKILHTYFKGNKPLQMEWYATFELRIFIMLWVKFHSFHTFLNEMRDLLMWFKWSILFKAATATPWLGAEPEPGSEPETSRMKAPIPHHLPTPFENNALTANHVNLCLRMRSLKRYNNQENNMCQKYSRNIQKYPGERNVLFNQKVPVDQFETARRDAVSFRSVYRCDATAGVSEPGAPTRSGFK